MLLQEPGRTQGDLNFSLLGIPVRINPWFWVTGILLGVNASDRDVSKLLIWVVALFISILWHELGHASVILAFGFRPWITLYGMGGLASYDPSRHRRLGGVTANEQMMISFAGPGAGFLLAAMLVGALKGAKGWRGRICSAVLRAQSCRLGERAIGIAFPLSVLRVRLLGAGEFTADLSLGRRPDRPGVVSEIQYPRRHPPIADAFDGCGRGVRNLRWRSDTIFSSSCSSGFWPSRTIRRYNHTRAVGGGSGM